MITPFDIWAPIFRAPFSGDVTQEITPRVFSPDIKGIPEIEARVQTEVASYGKQLGKVLEALEKLSDKTDTPLPEIDALIAGVEAVKKDSVEEIRAQAKTAIERLRKVDAEGYRAMLTTLGAEGKPDS